MEFHLVKDVKPLEGYRLDVTFVNDERRIYDINPLFDKWDDFNSLKSIYGLYELVKVDSQGFAVIWNNELDLACNELYFNGIPVAKDS